VEERALIRDGRLLVDRATVAGWVAAPDQRPLLLDVRAPERYRGEVEPLDARAGHIPGATNLPTASLVRSPADPRLLPPAELRAVLERAGAASGRDLVFSCGSGITACLGLLALEQAGLSPASAPARLYAGSFSDWISGEGAPVAVGSDPG
jgi:thiosulfate/3-mercaptopyruvate sulfurtransferase